MAYPAASRILAYKWQEERFRKHRYQIRNALPTVNMEPPKIYPHIRLNVNKIAIEEEKQARYEKENQILLQNLRNIVRGHGMLDNWNHYKKKPDLHAGARLKQQREIEWQNQQMLKRIKGTKPVIQKKKMDKDYQKSRVHKSLHDTTFKSYPLVKQKEVVDGVDREQFLESTSTPESDSHNTTRVKKRHSTKEKSPSPTPIIEPAETPKSANVRIQSPESTNELTQTPEVANDKALTPETTAVIAAPPDSPNDDKPAESDYVSDYEEESEADEERSATDRKDNSESKVKKTRKKKKQASATPPEEEGVNDHANRTAAVPKLPKI